MQGRETRNNNVADVATPEIARETLYGDGDGDDDESALPEASGKRALVTENRSSQPLATLVVHTSQVLASAIGSRGTPPSPPRPIDADRSRSPRTTLTLTPITRNYVSSCGTHACYTRSNVMHSRSRASSLRIFVRATRQGACPEKSWTSLQDTISRRGRIIVREDLRIRHTTK